MRAYLALFRLNLRLTLRDKAVIFFNYLFPLIFFFAFAELFHAGTGGGISFFVSTVLTMGILGNGLWGAGMRAVQERESNILRRYKVAPITPLPILLAAMISGWLLYMPVLVLLITLAHFVYGMPMPGQWLSLFIMVTLGVLAFRAIGLILAAVTNTMQEATIAIQLLYMPMLFLSGATVPAALLPPWAQTVAEFMPASYLVTGFQSVFFRHQTILDNLPAAGALLLTTVMGTFLAKQLFRWEKGERIRSRNKLWVLAVVGPFLLMGGYQVYSREHLAQNRALFRELQRKGEYLVRGARIVVGDGRVIALGSVMVRDGRIVEVYEGRGPDAEKLKIDVIEAAGKTLLPGLIDVHVQLSRSGGPVPAAKPDASHGSTRADEALLYSGITAARSMGDGLDDVLALRGKVRRGALLGAELSVCSPALAAHPKTPGDALRQVRELKQRGADCIAAALNSGEDHASGRALLRAILGEARAQGLSLAVQPADARDVAEALEAGARSIEGGSARDPLPTALLEEMARRGVAFVPMLGSFEAQRNLLAQRAPLLDQSLVQQTVPPAVLDATRALLGSPLVADTAREQRAVRDWETARANLLHAWQAGVTLAAGSGAGNLLLFHGPSLHHELQLWTAAGIPASVTLEAATGNAARLLGRASQSGVIARGRDADMMLLEANPLEDISATERISILIFKGERIRRSGLFDQK